ncbi:hypothetical protein DFQ28_009168 [Apophysomyces sp. BC1034]|nr:hypothetical protein DFQ30_007817 [Apophysomyces sp. BC1015]KAG0179264.1 hypothetical protein DFQ29_002325 [Apophysomyces sp. BC1021]KAG0192443.1 hypothetical protein DFQ28_009168 [Apophysomyces sp. BC1034]
MDVIVAETFSKLYTYCYDELLQFDVALPHPDRVFAAMSTAGQFLFDHSPELVRQLYVSIISVPANIVPVFLAIVVLYALFTLMLWIVRGIFRVVFGFVRFSLIVVLVATMLYFVQQHWGDMVLTKLGDIQFLQQPLRS